VAIAQNCFVIGALGLAIASGWDHRSFSSSAQQLDYTLIGVKCSVCQQSVGMYLRQQRVAAFQIMRYR